MTISSWERSGLDQRRAWLFVVGLALSLFLVVGSVGQHVGLGSASFALGAMAGVTAGYLVSTAPRRSETKAAFLQTMEAPSLASSSNIYLKVTGSRSKTFLLLRADEPHLNRFLSEVRRKILLGYDALSATRKSGYHDLVLSESAETVVNSVVGMDKARVEEGSDELEGVLNATGLEDETKLPVFIAVAFFLPIMLMLFAAMTKGTSLVAIGALAGLEVVILDLALAVSESSVSWRRSAEG